MQSSSVSSSVTSSVERSLFTEVISQTDPRPVQIVLAKRDHTFKLDEEALREILLSDEVRDKRVMVLSIAGAFRKGKSFLLDFLLRFLQRSDATTATAEVGSSWMGEGNEPLTGFSWRGGIDRDTTGILMWSRPFITTLPSGEEIAILLMDTQGAFDNQSTVKDCATIFALSTMVSSVQVYNLSMIIQENDLQHLHLFTEYGRLALEQGGDIKPFQSLCFLVRDWSCPDDFEYGQDGGSKYLTDQVLKIVEGQHEENRLVREHIHSCFDSVSCFLMPHPGLKVATSKKYDGRLFDIDSEFKNQLAVLAPSLLEPGGLIVKRINGNPITGSGLVECFKVYMKIFQSETLPQPKSMLEATAEANNLAAVATAIDKYNREMEELCGAEKPYLSPDKLEQSNKSITEGCLVQFRSTRKMGGEAFSKSYEEDLEQQLRKTYESFIKRNESKHILNAYRTPAVLFTIMVLSYILSSTLDLLGIESLSQTVIFGLYIPLLLVAIWAYVRYSGDFREFGEMIDNVAAVIWEQAIQPITSRIMQRGLQQAINLSTKQKTD